MKKRNTRIFITLGFLWFLFCFISFYNDITFNSLWEALDANKNKFEDAYYWLMASFIPLPLYFILEWINKNDE